MRREPEHQALIAVVWAGACGAAARWEQRLGCILRGCAWHRGSTEQCARGAAAHGLQGAWRRAGAKQKVRRPGGSHSAREG